MREVEFVTAAMEALPHPKAHTSSDENVIIIVAEEVPGFLESGVFGFGAMGS